MQLINTRTSKPVRAGDVVHPTRGQPAFITGWELPHGASSGRVFVQHMTDSRSHREYFPAICGLEWQDEA
jgi:hypothetical protein